MRSKQFIRLIFSLLFILGIDASTAGQSTITGYVIDAVDRTVLPFVNIGIKKKNIGTSSSLDGKFSIEISQQNENDTLTFSMVGYNELNLLIKDIYNSGAQQVELIAKVTELNAVTVFAEKLISKKFGISRTDALIHFIDASTNQDDIFEIAQVIKLGTSPSKITSVNLHINAPRNDSGTFRINFYEFDGTQPTQRIIEKSIIQTHQIKEGWLKFDLSNRQVYLKGNVVVAIEFIPTQKKDNPIYYELKLGGATKSYVRTSSQGDWATPAHHYKLFVTALVPDKGKKHSTEENERETAPSKVLFSEYVEDSFYVFVNLPKDYAIKSRKFPVIYLLDANVYFDIVANSMRQNKTKAILVGIGYKDFIKMDSLRERDYTFPKASPVDSFSISGGADKFLSFINKELIPYIDKTYRTDQVNRTLMGHSLGGYFSLYAFKEAVGKSQKLIANFVAASPSLDYCDNYILEEFGTLANSKDSSIRTVLVSFGGREDGENGGMGIIGAENFNSLCKLLSGEKYQNIKLKKEFYRNLRHMETAIPTFTKAIQEVDRK